MTRSFLFGKAVLTKSSSFKAEEGTSPGNTWNLRTLARIVLLAKTDFAQSGRLLNALLVGPKTVKGPDDRKIKKIRLKVWNKYIKT